MCQYPLYNLNIEHRNNSEGRSTIAVYLFDFCQIVDSEVDKNHEGTTKRGVPDAGMHKEGVCF